MNYEMYKKYIEKTSPKTSFLKNSLNSFLVGGFICMFGQFIKNFCTKNLNLSQELTEKIVPITLIFFSSLATGLNFYDSLAKKAGAGTLVPITGFANAMVSPAMEFKKEGYIFGVASKMFVLAGPVIVYGISTSIFIGIVLILLNKLGFYHF